MYPNNGNYYANTNQPQQSGWVLGGSGTNPNTNIDYPQIDNNAYSSPQIQLQTQGFNANQGFGYQQTGVNQGFNNQPYDQGFNNVQGFQNQGFSNNGGYGGQQNYQNQGFNQGFNQGNFNQGFNNSTSSNKNFSNFSVPNDFQMK